MIKNEDIVLYNGDPLNMDSGKQLTRQIIRGSWIVLVLTIIYQLIFHWSLTNIVAMGSVVIAWIVTTKFILRRNMLEEFPLSTFLLLGFTATQFYFPLLFTTLEGKELIFNLEMPEHVFFHSIAALVVMLLAHGFYRLISRLTSGKSFSILEKTGFFTPPTERQLWMMGIMGIAAAYYVYFTGATAEEGREVTGTAFDKFIQGLLPFQYAPFFIPLGKLFGGDDVNTKRIIPLLLAYTGGLFIVSVGRNSTGAFMFGFTAVAFGLALGLMMGIIKMRIFTVKNAILVALAGWFMIGPLSDLRTAMVLVRGQRAEVSAGEMINLTIDAYFDKEAIKERREYDIKDDDSEWDERYLDNVLTARFGNIKYNDINLVNSERVREYDPDMLQYSVDYMFGGLPEPFLKALKIDVDKEAVYSLSIGDYLYLAAGGYGTANAHRSGHFAGTGMATFSWWYLFILGLGMVIVFYLFDCFYRIKEIQSSDGDKTKIIQFSFCGLLALTSIFLYIVALQSVIEIATFIYRDWIQLAFLYFFMFHLTRVFSGSFMRNSEITRTLRRIKI